MKIVGMMVVGRGEGNRWLDKCLAQWRGLVDDAVIVGNNTDKKTEKIIKKHGYWFYRDDREWGIHQPRIKTDLYAKVRKLRPDWILPRDADEFYDKEFTREVAERLTKRGRISFGFYIVNLWNDEQHFRKSLGFANIRFFKHIGGIERFDSKSVHCGLAPPVYYLKAEDTPYMILHYGLMKPEDRLAKSERYKKYDPDRRFKPGQYYDEILRDTVGSPFNEEEIRNKLKSQLQWEEFSKERSL